ncbi:hypothetical protein DPMN_113520 [Dreissena polymorpha]|uniref:Uncharacterized protein n=1 Tax=Dreissena polymorpha TaxID=45954 RepID=A0A9D4KIF8_DREPO|nr:hypothetical protein DPMN_113520 [Dreissena polymorpha]
MLPRLTALALENNNQTSELKKREMALQLFEAYSVLSCCCILNLNSTVVDVHRINNFSCVMVSLMVSLC